MTEAEWHVCNDPDQLLTQVEVHLTDGELRKLAAMFALRVSDLFVEKDSSCAVDAALQHASGKMRDEDLAGYELTARQASSRLVKKAHEVWEQGSAPSVATRVWVDVWAACSAETACSTGVRCKLVYGEAAEKCVALRVAQTASWAREVRSRSSSFQNTTAENEKDVFFGHLQRLKRVVQQVEQAMKEGKPCEASHQAQVIRDTITWHPGFLEPTWRNPLIVAMVHTIAQERKLGDLPILADALDDLGFCDQAALNTLRSGIRCHQWDILSGLLQLRHTDERLPSLL